MPDIGKWPVKQLVKKQAAKRFKPVIPKSGTPAAQFSQDDVTNAVRENVRRLWQS